MEYRKDREDLLSVLHMIIKNAKPKVYSQIMVVMPLHLLERLKMGSMERKIVFHLPIFLGWIPLRK
uniref:Uncharacterized protein n=1 Tax=viral metagenome TaxID=1070528 RepID=A0A6C0KL85_9ZZZZ